MREAVQEHASASVTPLFLNRDGTWWDAGMLLALIGAAIAALIVAFFTYGSIEAHRREAKAAGRELEGYKAKNAGDVARAQAAGLAAGRAASEAQADVQMAKAATAAAQAEAAQANLRAASLEKDAAELSSALARTKLAVAGRWINEKQVAAIVRELAGSSFRIGICHDDSVEAANFASSLEVAFWKAGQTIVAMGKFCHISASSSEPVGLTLAFPEPLQHGQLDRDTLYRALVEADLYGGFVVDPEPRELAGVRIIQVPRRGAPLPESLEKPYTPPPRPILPKRPKD